MPLAAGELLGPYKIGELIGKGGMGEVYKAVDTRLDREVAIKVSAARFNDRFEREARAVAALNHANICTLYDVGASPAGFGFLVMEFVEGATLADLIKKGPIAYDEAWRLAQQIIAGLEAAHEKGIVHRDLKPANIKIRPDGTVKVLDFGLAKLTATRPEEHGENSPTLTMGMTEAGMILGTAAYMAPEQARGSEVDKRADIWAFGVVLYEMLTAERLFGAPTVSDTLAQVLVKEPGLDGLPKRVRTLVRSCLEKEPRRRLRDIGDAWRLLEEGGTDSPAQATSLPHMGSTWWWKIAAGVCAISAVAVGFVAYRHVSEEPPRVVKLSVLPPENSEVGPQAAVSPDGRRVAFSARSGGGIRLWVRDIDSLTPRPLPGTDGGNGMFWSPDSRYLGFRADGKLKKIDVTGGPALTLCEAPDTRGASWSSRGVIVYTPANDAGLMRVPAAGGNPTLLIDRNPGERSLRNPWFLPDGRHFLYSSVGQDLAQSSIYVGDLDSANSKTRRLVVRVNSNAAYAAPGYILYVRQGTLLAQPFDAGKLATTGDAIPVAEGVEFAGNAIVGGFSVSQNGVLSYLSGAYGSNSQLTWFDRTGKAAGTVGAPGNIRWGRISPDGRTVAADRAEMGGDYDLWLHDLVRGTASRFTFTSGGNNYPVWSPDGASIAFMSNREGDDSAYLKTTNGTAPERLLDKGHGRPVDWSRDGRYIFEEPRFGPKTGDDLWVLPLFGDRKSFPYLNSAFYEGLGRLSPNGQWLAYLSNESKRNEVYVVTFPTPSGKWQVSTNGGTQPVWSRDGRELYFIGADRKMMAVEVKGSANKFEAGVPKPLFDVRQGGLAEWFDVASDGRFLIPTATEESANPPLTVVVNWTAGLKK